MITSSGRSVFPDTEEGPSVSDIAIGLGRTVRFAGQTKIYYTVLAHTLVVSRIVSPAARIYALLHDAPEAVVSDVPTPWKTQMARDHEEDLMGRICAEHGIAWLPPAELWTEVLDADYAALCAEAHVLGHPAADDVWPTSDWPELVWKARDETLRQVARGCIWGLDPQTANAEFSREFGRAMQLRNPDTINQPISNKER